MKTIADSEVIAAINAAVEKRGRKWVDPLGGSGIDCRYSYDIDDYRSDDYEELDGYVSDRYRCIVGEILHTFGVADDDMEEWVADVHEVFEEHWSTFQFSPAIIDALKAAQMAQDRGQTWGIALGTFEQAYDESDRMKFA